MQQDVREITPDNKSWEMLCDKLGAWLIFIS